MNLYHKLNYIENLNAWTPRFMNPHANKNMFNFQHKSQIGYINNLLLCKNMFDYKTSPSLASIFVRFGYDIGTLFDNAYLYRSTVGAL